MKAAKEYIQTHIKRNIELRDLYKNIKRDLDAVERQLETFSQSKNAIIAEISSYVLKKTGKRIRPAILLLCSKLFGYEGREDILMSALVETIHTASLIHDDIIDNSDLRRGRETVHSRWGPNITVLLGDYLYIKTLGMALESDHRKIIQIFTETSQRMIEGELDEYYLSGNLDIEEKDYLGIIEKKTASLFSASTRIAGVLSGVSDEENHSLNELGHNFGMGFQIIDDLLDYAGDSKEMGKPVLSDLNEGRITLPLIYTLKTSDGGNRRRITGLLKNKKDWKEARSEIFQIVKSNGALDYTFSIAEKYSRRSKDIIQNFPESVYRDALELIPDFILTRTQ